jgi:tight adherence protein C
VDGSHHEGRLVNAATATGWLVAMVVVVAGGYATVAGRRVRGRVRSLSLSLSPTPALAPPAAAVAVAVAVRRGWHRSGRGWRLAGAAAAAGLVVGGMPLVGVSAGLVGWMLPRWRAASLHRRRVTALQREVPDVVDLLSVATASGLNLSLSVAAVGERGPPLLGTAFADAAREIDGGARIADGIERALAPFGDPVRPLATALLGSARYGTAFGPALDRLSVESRQLRRRHAEEAARRVPVKLLFPLVLLVLPAFVLLTLVPLLAGALRSLHL